jgi:hypothetical protein
MTTRERWIVYPLLFMTLGIALRDKITYHSGNMATQLEAGSILAPHIRCRDLQVGQLACERLLVNDPSGQPVVVAESDPNNQTGIVQTLAAGGMPLVRLGSGETGGSVMAVERGGKLALILGDTGLDFGVFAKLPGLGPWIPLTLPPWQFERKMPVPPKQPPKQPPAAPQQPPQHPSPPKAPGRSR